jgi:parvulin-like peptidyl-prolyl isomerase
MRTSRKIIIGISALLLLMLLSACRVGEERYELTNYMGKSVSTFERRSGTNLKEQGTGVYLMEEVVQIMAPDKKVNAISLLRNAGEYRVYGIGIGMAKSEVEVLLADSFGKEIAKTINEEKNTVTYTYLNNDKELYITYDNEKETVTELSYYIVDPKVQKEKEETEQTNSGELMIMVGDTRVYYNEAMVYLKSAQENYEREYGKDIWEADILGNGETFGAMIKEEVIDQITELKIIGAIAAKENITLSEEELADANAYAKEHFEGLTSEDITKYLITEELLRKIYADNLLAEKTFEYFTINVDNKVSDLDSKQIKIQQILINSVNYDSEGKATELSAEDKSAAYEKVQNLLEQAKTTEDFYALAEANSEAETIEYTFGRGDGPEEYSDSFEQAAFTLRTGQVSEIITTNYGWHILYCVSDYDEDATTQKKEEIISQRRSELFAGLYEGWTADYDVVVNSEAWNTISFE